MFSSRLVQNFFYTSTFTITRLTRSLRVFVQNAFVIFLVNSLGQWKCTITMSEKQSSLLRISIFRSVLSVAVANMNSSMHLLSFNSRIIWKCHDSSRIITLSKRNKSSFQCFSRRSRYVVRALLKLSCEICQTNCPSKSQNITTARIINRELSRTVLPTYLTLVSFLMCEVQKIGICDEH